MDPKNWLKLYGFAMGAFVAIGAIVVIGFVVDATEKPDIGPPRANISAL